MDYIRTNTREFFILVQKYIINAIDLNGYSKEEGINCEAKGYRAFNEVYRLFISEYYNNHFKRTQRSEKSLFIEWFRGMPSALNIDTGHDQIIKILKDWNVKPTTSHYDFFYRVIAREFFRVVKTQELTTLPLPKNNEYRITTMKEVRQGFWDTHTEFKSQYRKSWRQNKYNTTIRSYFVVYVDNLRRDNLISENLANKVTL